VDCVRGGVRRVSARQHDWVLDPPAALGGPFDMVVACDCVYEGGAGLPEALVVRC
jgi:hypothetical protein